MPEPSLATPAAPPLLEARDLTKHFLVHRRRRQGRTVHAVEQVSLSLAADGITAVVGESGSGKSTLARMLARLIQPTSGQILLDEVLDRAAEALAGQLSAGSRTKIHIDPYA